MKAGKLARLLNAVDPDLEVGFEVDDTKLDVVRVAEFRFVKVGPAYVYVNVEVGDGPGYRPVVHVPFHELKVDEGAVEDA